MDSSDKLAKTNNEGESTKLVPCKRCRELIQRGASLCTHCKSYQDWRHWFSWSTPTLALLTALVSIVGLAGPRVYELVHVKRSDASLRFSSLDGTTLRVVADNQGDANASVQRAWVDSDYLAMATKVRFRDDQDALVPPGTKMIAFDIVPLLDENESYRSSLEMLTHILKETAAPRTEIRFHIQQSDGRFAVQAISLSAAELFDLLRSNADRCSSVDKPNFQNGCIGTGLPESERYPYATEDLPDAVMEEMRRRVRR